MGFPHMSTTKNHGPDGDDRRVDASVTRRRAYIRAHGINMLASVTPETLTALDFLVLMPEEIEAMLTAGRHDRKVAERSVRHQGAIRKA